MTDPLSMLSPIDEAGLQPVGTAAVKQPSVDKDGQSFKDVLQGLVSQVDSLQRDADSSIRGLIAGQETDVHNVAIKMEEASVAFDLMMSVRNKLLEAYQEISRMAP
jgi:flagellar hook-basal body complex protein FliE